MQVFFLTAEDLGILMYMFMNNGNYGGVQYLNPSTLDEFTSCQFCDEGNRRAIGFDKPSLEKNSGPTCNAVSALSFGHSGFTGTLAWADPKEDLVYVFLSNRVYPNADNTKIVEDGHSNRHPRSHLRCNQEIEIASKP